MSSDATSKSPLQGLLLLAVLGLCGWCAWLTLENQKLSKALGQSGGGGGELAGKVASLEETIENGLVLSLIDPSRGSTLLKQPVRPVSADAVGQAGAARSPISLPGKAAPREVESDDPNAPFDFSTDGDDTNPEPDEDVIDGFKGGASFLDGSTVPTQGSTVPTQGSTVSTPGFDPGFIQGQGPSIGPDNFPQGSGPDDFGPTPAPEGTVSSREPPPSTGTFGSSQNLLDGGGDTYLYELTILEVQDNGFIGLDGGSSSGVKVGTLFAVMRGTREIGKVRVQELSESRSIGEIAEFVGGVTIRKGDRVVPLRN